MKTSINIYGLLLMLNKILMEINIFKFIEMNKINYLLIDKTYEGLDNLFLIP